MSFTLNNLSARRAGVAVAVALFALSLSQCKDASQPAPETGTDYYPVKVGNFWVYAVADTTWSVATQSTPSVATATAYQFKETIVSEFTDAAGKKAFRMVRSKKGPTTTSFRDDSVFVVSANGQFVAVNRSNSRTVELIFPVRDGRLWNFNAFNNDLNDTINAETRRYFRVGEPFTTRAVAGNAAQTYSNTLTTADAGAAAENSLLKRIGYQQVFAKGIGPVYRRRDLFLNFNYTDSSGKQVYVADSYTAGFSRRETLIEYGPR